MVNIKGQCRSRILRRYQADLLARCQEFRTINEHAQTIYNALRGKQKQACAIHSHHSAPLEIGSIKKQLAGLIESGFLITDKELLDRCRQLGEQKETVPLIASIGVVTRNRPESMRRCLESYIDTCKRHGRTNNFVVVDDSTSAEVRKEIRNILYTLRRRFGVDIFYAGMEEKISYAKLLTAESDAPPDVVNFALLDTENCGYTAGANRNAFLLQTIGDLVFCADDDTICKNGALQETKSGLAFNSVKEDFMEFRHYPTRASALDDVAFSDEDILSANEQALGNNLGDCIARCSSLAELHLGHLGNHLFSGLQHGGRVIATLPGVVGDSGAGSPAWCLSLEGRSRQHLLRSEEVYQSAGVSREMVRAAERVTISDSTWCMLTALGMDN